MQVVNEFDKDGFFTKMLQLPEGQALTDNQTLVQRPNMDANFFDKASQSWVHKEQLSDIDKAIASLRTQLQIERANR